MSEYLLILLIVAGIAGFIFWNSRKGAQSASPAQSEAPTQAVTDAPAETSAETGVARYMRNLPPPPVETGVARYIRRLPKPAPETGVTRYLKALPEPTRPETGVSRYLGALTSTPAAQRAELTLEKLIASIPAPTSESGVARYLKAVHGV
jgi:hypothetical protein